MTRGDLLNFEEYLDYGRLQSLTDCLVILCNLIINDENNYHSILLILPKRLITGVVV